MTPTITKEISSQLTDKQIAERATLQNFLNCYLRETGNGDRLKSDQFSGLFSSETQEIIRLSLSSQNISILAGLRYFSPTGRHLFSFPIYYQIGENTNFLELDYVTLVALITKEISLSTGSMASQDELLFRIIQSCQYVEQFVKARKPESHTLYAFQRSFIETEQALIFGHHLHPTPKSRQGFTEEELPVYSPELKGSFPLYYFRAHLSVVQQGSNLSESATNLIKQELLSDSTVSEAFKQQYCQEDDYALIPVHPWQANYLRAQPGVQTLLNQGLLEDLGQQGKPYLPTSSIRTVYSPNSAFMFKLSLNVKITNSVRSNLYKELERGVEISRILESPIGQDLRQHFPQFDIIRDPAYITVSLPGEKESGFATVLRANPFSTETDATCLISLCQDAIAGKGSRLATIITELASQEKRSTEAVSLDWFRRYLDISLKPILWLYFTYGIAVEAHQQNSVLQLNHGYPDRFFYRDNQGYYYRRSFHYLLNTILPGISEKSETVVEDAVVDERLTYYLFINNLFGLINTFGVAGLVNENLLLTELNKALETLAKSDTGGSCILENLGQPKLRSKANLLTRFHNMDELVGSVATQSVYGEMNNPLVTAKSEVLGGIHV